MQRTTVRSMIVIASVALSACSTAAAGGAASTPSSGTSMSATSVPSPSGGTGPAAAPRSDWMPNDIAFGPDGNLYISDCWRHRVYMLSGSSVTTIAGVGNGSFDNGSSGDGGPATAARFTCAFGLAFDGAGDLYVADHGNNRVRMIDPSGTITTVAGSGPTGFGQGAYAGDGGPATQARLMQPTWLATDAFGDLYIADRDNDVIRKVNTKGIITTVAGTGKMGYSGDGGPGSKAKIDDPEGLEVDAQGNLIFGDSNNARIRMVDREGTITTIAGTGKPGYTGDGGPADQARIEDLSGLTIGPDGTIYFVQQEDHVIRAIDRYGIIRTVVGSGHRGCPKEGQLATRVNLRETLGLAVDGHGRLVFASDECDAVYRRNGAGKIEVVAR